jgi:hypothetical protein
VQSAARGGGASGSIDVVDAVGRRLRMPGVSRRGSLLRRGLGGSLLGAEAAQGLLGGAFHLVLA